MSREGRIALVVVVVMCAVGWWTATRDGAPSVTSTSGAPVAAPSLRTSAPTSAHASPQLSVPPWSTADLVGPGRVEVCGVGVMSEEDARKPEVGERQFKASPGTESQFASDLAKERGDAGQALALYLEGWKGMRRVRGSFDDRMASCGQESECEDKVMKEAAVAARVAFEPSLQALLRLTATTTDPVVFAIAAQRCSVNASPLVGISRDACSAFSMERWAQIDPDNAVPWMHLASAARVRNDDAAFADAMFHAGVARKVTQYGDALLSISASAIDRRADPVDRLRLRMDVLDIEAGWSLPPYKDAMDWCKAADANRRQVCDSLGTTLVERSRTMIDLAIGARIGELSGWDKARVASLRMRHDAYQAAATRVDGQDLSSCAGWQREMDDALQRSRVGEQAYARDAASKSGKSIEALAASMNEQRRRAARAASAASASPATSGAR